MVVEKKLVKKQLLQTFIARSSEELQLLIWARGPP